MPCPCPAVPSPVVALPGWCPLSPAGAQSTQLLVEPPWTPAVLWDRVTLTCQGSGTAGATTWYRNGQRWGQERRDSFRVPESGTYRCDRPGTRLSPPVTVSNDWLVLQVPARALLEGDTVTLRCRGWGDNSVTSVSFYRDGNKLGTLRDGTELSLSPLQMNHSGRYHCRGRVGGSPWMESAQVTVTVQVVVNVGRTLLYLLLLLAVIGGCRWWHRRALRKEQERPPQEPSAPPEEGAVLDPHIVGTERAGAPGDHEELPGPHGGQRHRRDSYENVQ
ncbi:low affinity immunoglobulin gamma Fc region receptor III-like [Acridotheres tristis]